MKTLENWRGGLMEYLEVGDTVDQAMADYFVDCLPPARDTGKLIQLGEPYSFSDEGKSTYATLAKEDGEWVFKGACHVGETIAR
ncbi:hypothetical protein IMZ31_18835 (plasmid) [Pontibacillus sp. ALD_SL1]|uniref:hypothetical protein n=1 Tax=Pontibacillus sp. ALD_SL1 TaxID=2777185 RepID=UPI001A974CAA|nr:hypothetical protein [Pontibacillus sp. ALD_SL1]QST02605.1 hypothetical protein IMZ31_18835 [Pontibacillus sp. ALD_SL1]